MSDSAILTLPVGVTENTVRVHPVVLFTICDAYIRRSENQERVIGTLLGSIGDGVVDIKTCYAVPHSESNEQVGFCFATLWFYIHIECGTVNDTLCWFPGET